MELDRGALDNLSAPTGGFGFCTKPDNAGVSVIGWDDGTCYSWGTSEVGVTVVWTQSCAIVKEAVYFNASFPFAGADLESTALQVGPCADAPPTGCGCASTQPAAWLLLAALGVSRRRRRYC